MILISLKYDGEKRLISISRDLSYWQNQYFYNLSTQRGCPCKSMFNSSLHIENEWQYVWNLQSWKRNFISCEMKYIDSS